jgi:Uma2 family endonuclease
LYGRRGVEEYWLLDPAARTVSVYRRAPDGLAFVALLDEAGTLTSPVLPGFAAAVARLFPARKQP